MLQRLLNTHPALVVLGEHDGALREIARAHATLTAPALQGRIEEFRPPLADMLASRPIPRAGEWTTEWTNAFTPESLDAAFRAFIAELILPASLHPPGLRWWGFKEIRYGPPVAEFLHRLYPEARFLVLLRDPVATARSQLAQGWWMPERTPEQVAGLLHEDCARLHDLAARLDALSFAEDRCRLLDYGALLAQPRAMLDGLAAWLGVPPFPAEKLAVVLGEAPNVAAPAMPLGRPGAEACLAAYRDRFAAADAAAWEALKRRAVA